MDFVIKFAQAHESFRLAEIQALAVIEGVDLEVLEYRDDVCVATSLQFHYNINTVAVPLLHCTSSFSWRRS